MIFINLFALIISLFPHDVAFSKAIARTINGIDAEENEFPSTVLLKKHKKSFCGGFLLDATTVVTAAHCFNKTHTMTVVAGETNLKKDNDDVYDNDDDDDDNEEHDKDSVKFSKVINGIMHEKFSENEEGELSYDISILHLENPILESNAIKYANLPKSRIKSGEDCVFTGWGTISQTETASALQKTVFTILKDNQCNTGLDPKKSGFLCTKGKHEAGICNGDSGSPLYCNINGKQVVSGIASFSYDYEDKKGCDTSRPNYFVNVYKYLHWIEQKREILSAKKNGQYNL